MFCCFSFNISFYLIFAFFFLLSQKKEEETYECFAFCKKKKERPWAGICLQANMGIFRLFSLGKSFDIVEKGYSV